MISELVERLMKVDVTEICSPSRVTLQAEKFGLKGGEAFHLTNGWAFRSKHTRVLPISMFRRRNHEWSLAAHLALHPANCRP